MCHSFKTSVWWGCRSSAAEISLYVLSTSNSLPLCFILQNFRLAMQSRRMSWDPYLLLNHCHPNSCPPTLSLPQFFFPPVPTAETLNGAPLSPTQHRSETRSAADRGQDRFALDREDAISSANLWVIQHISPLLHVSAAVCPLRLYSTFGTCCVFINSSVSPTSRPRPVQQLWQKAVEGGGIWSV